jgi:hypothetical protein
MSHTTAPPPQLDTDVIKKDSVTSSHVFSLRKVTTFLAEIYGFDVDDALRQLGLHNFPVEKVVKEKKPRAPSEAKVKLLAEFEELGLTSIDTSLSIKELRKTLRKFKEDAKAAKQSEKSDAKAASERTRLLKNATGLIPKMEMLDVAPPTEDELDAMPIEELTAFVADTRDAIKTYKQTKAAEKALAAEEKKTAAEAKKTAAEAKKTERAAEKAAKTEKKAERAAQKKAKIDELIAKIQTHLPDYVAPEDPKIGDLNKKLKECSPAETRPRGRPKNKVSAATDDSDEDGTTKEVKPKKKRGRPAKTNKVVESVGNDLIAALVKQAAEASTDEDSAPTTSAPTTDLNKTPTPTPERPLELELEQEEEEEEEEETLYEWEHDEQILLKNTPEDLPGYIYRHTAESTDPAATTLPFAHWTGPLICLL